MLKVITRLAQDVHKEAWDKLSAAIRVIYNKNASELSFEELYRSAYNMVLHKQGEKLYNGVKEVISSLLVDMTRDTITPAFPQPLPGGGLTGGSEFLKSLRDTWQDHTTCMRMIRDILRYMDYVYVKQTGEVPVYELGLDLYRDVVIRSSTYPVQKHLRDTVLYLVKLEREGEVVDRPTIRSVTDMLLALNDGGKSALTVYEADLEPALLTATKAFYQMESQLFIKECDAIEYLKRTERRLREEETRVNAYLSAQTDAKIRAILEEELLQKNVKQVIEMESAGMVSMMTNDRYDDLKRMYQLFGRVSNGHAEMRTCVSSQIEALVMNINQSFGGVTVSACLEVRAHSVSRPNTGVQPDQANPSQWVDALLVLRDKFNAMLEKAFSNNIQFEADMNASFQRSVNRNRKAPEFVSLFIDENLRKRLKGKTDEEIESLLEKTISLFRYVEEKDVFERYFKQHLAKRLLFQKSVSTDAERNLIARLKIECGYQFTTKLEGMFTDIKTAEDTMTAFREQLSTSRSAPSDMPEINVTVLTTTYWPMTQRPSADPSNFPKNITGAMEYFQKFYHSRHSGRRLTWLPHMGTADIKATFDKGRKEINIPTYGMVVLIGVFNDVADGEWVTYKRIAEMTAIPEMELKRILQSMSLAKFKILQKKIKSKEIADDDAFRVNLGFTAPQHKIRILQITGSAAAENDKEREETLGKVDTERKHLTEACIVRIMKSRRQMDHNNLIAEVAKQLGAKFTPSPQMVKKRIEGLIEREYLERDKENR
ncbi:Cullin [Gaertneriomyces semiglobifer]|nr:Cullin [Gaertneriomyces semiglobifer]